MKKLINILLINLVIIYMFSSCKVQKQNNSENTITQITTTVGTTEILNIDSKVDRTIDYTQILIDFLKNPKIVEYVKQFPYEPMTGGPRISLLDMTDDDIPECIITILKEKPLCQMTSTTTIYDIYTCEPLLTFNGGNMEDNDICRFKDKNGTFKCVVYEHLYLGDGKYDDIITQITPNNNTFTVETKIAVRCYREDTQPFAYYYNFITNLSENEEKIYRYWENTDPDINAGTIFEYRKPVEIIWDMCDLTESETYNDYISSLIPLETNLQEIGVFWDANHFEPQPSFENVLDAIKDVYDLKSNP